MRTGLRVRSRIANCSLLSLKTATRHKAAKHLSDLSVSLTPRNGPRSALPRGMNNALLKSYVKVLIVNGALWQDDSGQDLVEYALVVSLIALGATATMQSLATSFSTALSAMGSKLATYTS